MQQQHDASSIAHSPPLAGIVLTIAGATAWAYGFAARLLVDAPATYHVDALRTVAPMAQATINMGGASITLSDLGQIIGGLCSLIGILVTCYNVTRAKLAKGDNERKLEAGMTDVKLFVARRLAEIEVKQAENHAAQCEHLSRQDKTLAAVQQALPMTPDGAK